MSDVWWLMADGWCLMADDWWLMADGWCLMADGWWLMADGWWLMADGWWLMSDGWWLMADGWCLMADGWCLRSSESVGVLKLFIYALKTDRLMENCPSSAFRILRFVSSYLTTIQSVHWAIRLVNISLRIRNYCADNGIIAIFIPPHISLRLHRPFS